MEKTLKVNTKEIKTKNADGTVTSTFERSLDLPTPKIFMHETIESLVSVLGGDYCLHTLNNGMKVSWRAKMRNAMEKRDDNGEFENADEIMISLADPSWQPELRMTKTNEEKAEEALLALAPEKLEAMMLRYKEIMKKKKKA